MSKIQEILESGQCPGIKAFRKPYLFKGKTVRAFREGKEIPATEAKNQWPTGNPNRVRQMYHDKITRQVAHDAKKRC